MTLSRINNNLINAHLTNAFRGRAFVQNKDTVFKIVSDTSENSKVSKEPKENDGCQFDDNKLAMILGIGNGTTISTEKSIHWEADGSAKLTDEQIDYLKSKYDIANMSRQDYYDLMSDLTNMNVLSGKEVKNQHVAPVIMGAVSTSVPAGIGEGEYSDFQGNLQLNVNSKLQSISDWFIALNDKNWYFSGQNTQRANDDLLGQKHIYQKLASIYDLIKKD